MNTEPFQEISVKPKKQVPISLTILRREDGTNMENVSDAVKLESIKSLQSTISKSENALAQMTEKGANTTLIKKRLKALYVGLAILENVWNQKPHNYIREDLAEAHNILCDLFPSIALLFGRAFCVQK